MDPAIQTMYADLVERCHDAAFDAEFDLAGNFVKRSEKGKLYWYYEPPMTDGSRPRKYVGPDSDPAVASRVEGFGRLKTGFRERQRLVRALRAAGMPAPDSLSGRVLEKLAVAGAFRLRAVLVGSMAFQTYAGLLGVRLPGAALTTSDVDIAQFHSVSVSVGDELPLIEPLLKEIDGSFRPVPHISGHAGSTAFINAAGFKVEFLTPNRGKAEYGDRPASLPALGTHAQALRYLDFLIYEPVRAVLLHGPGLLVNVPAPARYAVHKLIVAVERNNPAKRPKDIRQAGLLIDALAEQSPHELLETWIEAWNRGPAWKENLLRGRAMLSGQTVAAMELAFAGVAKDVDCDLTAIGFTAAGPEPGSPEFSM